MNAALEEDTTTVVRPPIVRAEAAEDERMAVVCSDQQQETPPVPSDVPAPPSRKDPNPRPSTNSFEQHAIKDQTVRLPFARFLAAYLCLCLCYFTSYLDMNAATLALPTIARALSAGFTITWAGTAFLLGQTAFQPLYGRLSDIAGRKPVLMASIASICLGGLLAGFARAPAWLYAARALNGIGSAGVSSLVAIIVGDLVSLKDRGRYQGYITMAMGAGGTCGPFVAAGLVRSGGVGGGLFGDGWRWALWVPAVVAAGCFAMLFFLLPLKPVRGNGREKLWKIDWFGIGASVTGIVLLLIPINSGGSLWPWTGPLTISMLVVGGVFFVVFVLVEGFVAKIPIMPLYLFKQRPRTILYVQGMLHDFVWQATQYFVPLYLQTVRGCSPLQSATLILPYLGAQSLAGAISGPVMTKHARYLPVLRFGFALWTLGAGLKLLFSLDTPTPVYAVALAVEGAGVGFVHQPGLVALQALSTTADRAVATSTRNLLRSLGGVAGVAVSTAVVYAITSTALRDVLPPPLLERVLGGSWQLGDADAAAFEPAILAAKLSGFRTVFVTSVPLMGVCLLASFFVSDVVLQGDSEKRKGGGGDGEVDDAPQPRLQQLRLPVAAGDDVENKG